MILGLFCGLLIGGLSNCFVRDEAIFNDDWEYFDD